MKDPPPPRTSSRAECLSTYMLPLTFRSTARRQPSESTWVSGPMVSVPPAQCTTPFSRPVQAVAASDRAGHLVLVGDIGGFEADLAVPGPRGDLVDRRGQFVGVTPDQHARCRRWRPQPPPRPCRYRFRHRSPGPSAQPK